MMLVILFICLCVCLAIICFLDTSQKKYKRMAEFYFKQNVEYCTKIAKERRAREDSEKKREEKIRELSKKIISLKKKLKKIKERNY